MVLNTSATSKSEEHLKGGSVWNEAEGCVEEVRGTSSSLLLQEKPQPKPSRNSRKFLRASIEVHVSVGTGSLHLTASVLLLSA